MDGVLPGTGLSDWHWCELQQVGTDYMDLSEVERYERRMGEFRNLGDENAGILRRLALPTGSSVLEIGTGTGHFARFAAAAGMNVTAIDVSPVMLEYARRRAVEDGIGGIVFLHAGFLTQKFAESSFDAVVSGAALHHLPDAWKAVALANVARVLKPGGQFILRDIVFSFEPGEHAASFESFVSACPAGMRKEAARHVAKEYSTLGWIMEGLLERAGLRVLAATEDKACLLEYHCRKD